MGKGSLEKTPYGKLALTLGEVFQFERDWLPEVMGFVPCSACGEPAARAYLRILGEKPVCIPCSGDDR
ncbi:TraR/DksA C4-type zinc finger protein [uncultured Thiodictyon sp.]|uniref:TraR/DksA C4-type zinc finger protein n=1 Tax=uncultured Thiodictyon sp. TaxID=1846217 RepID=UPI0025FC6B57|nr:TraR/DksA C4-type zinc finger protein [uncultured Thiodictyon sp.]